MFDTAPSQIVHAGGQRAGPIERTGRIGVPDAGVTRHFVNDKDIGDAVAIKIAGGQELALGFVNGSTASGERTGQRHE
jgi:hypothetical protein